MMNELEISFTKFIQEIQNLNPILESDEIMTNLWEEENYDENFFEDNKNNRFSNIFFALRNKKG